MTVLHIIEPFASGITTFLIQLTKHLPEHDHIVLHGTRTSVDTVDKVRGRFPRHVTFIEWRYVHREIELWRDLKAFFFLIRVLRSTPVDVVHLHSSKAGFLGRIACFLLNKRSIYTPHAVPFLRTDVGSITRKMYILLERFPNWLNGRIVSCCHSEQIAYQKINISTHCINNGTDIVPVAKSENKRVVIIFSALITQQKDPSLFNAIAEGLRSETDIELYWVGDGELRHVLTAENITITGWLDHQDVKAFYQRADIYLSTSAWEGLPYGVLEAMVSSCCLVLTKKGGHVDLVNPGENGFLYETCDEALSYLRQLIANRNQIRQMGNASRMRVEKEFDVMEMARQYNHLYVTCTHK